MELPEPVKARLQAPLGALAELGLKPVSPDLIHLTLHFLGELVATQEERLVSAIDEGLQDALPFELTASGVGAFPSMSRPQVLWAAVETNESLMDLHARLARAIATVGLPVEERGFRPHLTLTRLRARASGQMMQGIREWSKKWAEHDFGAIPVESVILFHSQLGAGPARHTPVKSFRLK